jgi:hypothetical protein
LQGGVIFIGQFYPKKRKTYFVTPLWRQLEFDKIHSLEAAMFYPFIIFAVVVLAIYIFASYKT